MASDGRVVQVRAGLRRREGKGGLDGWSKGTEGKAREAEEAEAERGIRRRKVYSGFNTVFLSLLLLAAGVGFPAACFWR